MTNIKVTVAFEEVKTSRIDALLKEYEIASKIANETKRELMPIIKEVGLAKHAAIMKQLEPIMDGAKKLSMLKSQTGWSNADTHLEVRYKHPGVDDRYFKIVYKEKTNTFNITYCMSTSSGSSGGEDFTKATSDPYNLLYGAERGIITHWNKLGIIDKLNQELEKQIENATWNSFEMKKNIEKKLNNLIND